MEYDESAADARRRSSILMEQQARRSIVQQQPRSSVASVSSTGASTFANGSHNPDVMMDVMRIIRAKKVSQRMRRKSMNPKLDPPPGLEGINDKGFVYIRQQMENDIKGGCGSPNTYKIWDEQEEELFYVLEDSSCCCRWCCGPHRQFRLEFYTPSDDLVFTLNRKSCRCDWCCFLDCCLCNHKVYIVDCLNRTLGSVKQRYSICAPKFDIVDNEGNVVAKILGGLCPCKCDTEQTFEIYNKTGEELIGSINKRWEGNRDDGLNVDHEYFDIHFPEKMDPIEKMLVIGGAFLVDYMYFEMS